MKNRSLSLQDILDALREHNATLKRQFGVDRIAVFGSYARREPTGRSDVDLCVELQPKAKTFDNYMNLKFFLEKQFGKKVDLVLKESIRPELALHIMSEAIYG